MILYSVLFLFVFLILVFGILLIEKGRAHFYFSKACATVSKISGWTPKNKGVLLLVDESGQSSLIGKTFNGVVLKYLSAVQTVGADMSAFDISECAVIEVDSVVNVNNGRPTRFFALIPRYSGESIYGIRFQTITVYICPLSGEKVPERLNWKEIIGIGSLKLNP